VCWKNFAAAPLSIHLQSDQTVCRVYFNWNKMFPIRHAKEPLCKGLEAHLATDSLQH